MKQPREVKHLLLAVIHTKHPFVLQEIIMPRNDSRYDYMIHSNYIIAFDYQSQEFFAKAKYRTLATVFTL